MTKLTSIIVDDEALARERIRTLLQGEPDIAVVAECTNGAEAIAAIQTHSPSILFLDVQMPGVNGFEVLSAIAADRRPPAIIFVTAYDHYAVRAFETNAVDYLLKPYTKDRFGASLRRARSRLEIPAGTSQQIIEKLLHSIVKRAAVPERIPVRSKTGIQFIRTSDIDWFEADGNYTWLHAGSRVLRAREALSNLEAKLGAAGFIRIHRSIMLNVDSILELEASAHGEYVIVLRNGKRLSSSRTYSGQIRGLIDT
jgi:two-component system, LytTR family, response regulator